MEEVAYKPVDKLDSKQEKETLKYLSNPIRFGTRYIAYSSGFNWGGTGAELPHNDIVTTTKIYLKLLNWTCWSDRDNTIFRVYLGDMTTPIWQGYTSTGQMLQVSIDFTNQIELPAGTIIRMTEEGIAGSTNRARWCASGNELL